MNKREYRENGQLYMKISVDGIEVWRKCFIQMESPWGILGHRSALGPARVKPELHEFETLVETILGDMMIFTTRS